MREGALVVVHRVVRHRMVGWMVLWKRPVRIELVPWRLQWRDPANDPRLGWDEHVRMGSCSGRGGAAPSGVVMVRGQFVVDRWRLLRVEHRIGRYRGRRRRGLSALSLEQLNAKNKGFSYVIWPPERLETGTGNEKGKRDSK